MSCALSRKLREHPDALLVEGSPERRWGLRHAEECPACRRTLLRLDPTLAVAAPSVPEFDSREVESLKAGVLNAKRLREMEAFSGRSIRGSQVAAAVTLIASLALLLPGQLEETGGGRGDAQTELSRILAPSVAEISLPAVETLDLPLARVYELGEEDFSVVMIVDESLDL
jgi:hypothetical protein